MAALALSLGLLAFGMVVLLLSRRDLQNARAQLSVEVLSEARAEQRSPRDPAVLLAVQRMLPRDLQLVPSPDVLATGRVEMVSRRLRTTAGRECVVLPVSSSGRVVPCSPTPSPRSTAASRVRGLAVAS